MGVNFNSIANLIAQKLDAKDTKGQDNLVELSIWNQFAETTGAADFTRGKENKELKNGIFYKERRR